MARKGQRDRPFSQKHPHQTYDKGQGDFIDAPAMEQGIDHDRTPGGPEGEPEGGCHDQGNDVRSRAPLDKTDSAATEHQKIEQDADHDDQYERC